MARGNRRKTTKKAKPKKKAGSKKSSSAASTGNGGGMTIYEVTTNDDKEVVCGNYDSMRMVDLATGSKEYSTKACLAPKRKKNPGIVGSDNQYRVRKVENCTRPVGPTEFGRREGKWKMKDHAPGPGAGSNVARVGDQLGRLLNSSKQKISGDKQDRTIGDAVKGVETKSGEQLDGLVVLDGDTFAKLMAWDKSRIGQKLKRLKKKGSNKASCRIDNGKPGTFPQFWYVDGLRKGLDDYKVFTCPGN